MGAQGMVAPPLTSEHRGELHEARAPSWRAVSATRQDRHAVGKTRGLHRNLLLRGCADALVRSTLDSRHMTRADQGTIGHRPLPREMPKRRKGRGPPHSTSGMQKGAASPNDLPVRDDGRGTHRLCACIAGAEVIARRGMVALGLVRRPSDQTGGSSECPKRLRVWTGKAVQDLSPSSSASDSVGSFPETVTAVGLSSRSDSGPASTASGEAHSSHHAGCLVSCPRWWSRPNTTARRSTSDLPAPVQRTSTCRCRRPSSRAHGGRSRR